MGERNSSRQIDKYWEKIFEEYDILEKINSNRLYEISADDIKRFKEPRLMTKFDYKDSLPDIFNENNLSLLPISRGGYVIGKFKGYEDVENTYAPIRKCTFPEWIEGMDYTNLYSEASVINCAYISGIINDVLQTDECYMTISGRMGTGKFSFNIVDSENDDCHTIDVLKAQCEVDGAFESDKAILLLEAKNSIFNDFIVRQLYYPYRVIRNNVEKKVIPAYLTYSNNILDFHIYEFEDENNYNSIKLKEIKRYIIDDFNINMETIKNILKDVKIAEEPVKIPFPQANTFENIVNIMGKLYEIQSELPKDDLTIEFAFHKRQADYYANAAYYLGFVNINKGNIELSELGTKIMEMRTTEKYSTIIKTILSYGVFNKVMKRFLKEGEPLKTSEIVEIMKECNININDRTKNRRAQTVSAWIKWILELTNNV